MPAADGKISFGAWLPDIPAHDNPGLVTAQNVVWLDGAYRPYLWAASAGAVGGTATLAGRPYGALSALAASGSVYTYAATQTTLYVKSGSSFSSRTAAPYATAAAGFWQFATFDEYIIATNAADVPQALTIGSGSNFAALALTGTAPKARVVGVVGRHLVLGNTNDGTAIPYRIQWSRIDDPTEWPVLFSADALAKQSGAQDMPSKNGSVTGIVGNDQFGIVIQESGVSRMTYVGGDLVYQFDEIDGVNGTIFPNAIVRVSDLAYFISTTGICVTDGVSVKNLTGGKINTVLGTINTTYKERVYGALDAARGLIYWAYSERGTGGAGQPNRIIVYNIKDDRASLCLDSIECLWQILTADSWSYDQRIPKLYTFDSSNRLAGFADSNLLAGRTVQIDTGEVELNPGLFTRVSGVKLTAAGWTNSTIALGYRTSDELNGTPTFTSYTAPTVRTGFADFRVEARHVRASVRLGAGADHAMGIEFSALASGVA